jgi:predicted nucleic acid-binding protein
MKILIDTNIYLDFYRSNNEALKLFDEMEAHFDKIILTDQIIMEFERSRETVIRKVKQSFESESQIEKFSSSYLQTLPEFKELVELQKQYLNKRKEVSNVITESIRSQVNDPVAAFFKRLVNESYQNDTVYITTEEIINKAHRRKLIGNPPTTADKYSIGDEINWEIVLNNVKEDMIIVGRDNTFRDNFSFLQKDFHRHTGKFIVKLTERITDALQEVGVETSKDLGDAENRMIEEIHHANDFWRKSISTQN